MPPARPVDGSASHYIRRTTGFLKCHRLARWIVRFPLQTHNRFPQMPPLARWIVPLRTTSDAHPVSSNATGSPVDRSAPTTRAPMTPETAKAATSPPASVNLAELLDVIRPQVEKIEEGFKAIRVTLDALAEHLGTAPAAMSEKRTTPAAVNKEPAPQEERRPAAEPRSEPPMAAPLRVPPTETLTPAQPSTRGCHRTWSCPHGPADASGFQADFCRFPAAPRRPGRPRALASAANPPRFHSRHRRGWRELESNHFWRSAQSRSGHWIAQRNLVVGGPGQRGRCRRHVGLLVGVSFGRPGAEAQAAEGVGRSLLPLEAGRQPAFAGAADQLGPRRLGSRRINNRIDLVQVGDRYDMQRHNAKERGAEVSAVAGWVVLRDNGKVYSKANVSVR